MDVFSLLLSFLLGAAVGSFVNVAVFRTRDGMSLVTPPSRCPACLRAIFWYDNVPVFGFLLLGGKCRNCKAPISIQYPLTEFALGAIFAAFAVLHGLTMASLPLALVRDWAVASFLAAVFLYDLRYGEIPDRFTLLPAALFFGASLIFGWVSPTSMALGALLAAGFFLLQYVASRGRWIGGGDVRLGVFMGVLLGFPGVLAALFISYLLGAAAAIILMLLGKKQMGETVPFGTFLAVGTLIAMARGNEIITWYLNLLG